MRLALAVRLPLELVRRWVRGLLVRQGQVRRRLAPGQRWVLALPGPLGLRLVLVLLELLPA